MKRTQVVNCNRSKYDVYIGRPSKWANPYQVGRDGDHTTVLLKYKFFLLCNKQLIESAKKELKGKILGCHCYPYPCHGDILARLIDEDN